MNEFVVTMIEREAEEAERRAAAFRKIAEAARDLGDEGLAHIRNLVELPNENGSNGHVADEPKASPAPAADMPRGREAVRRIVSKRPGIWTLADLREEMKRLGWFTSAKAVEVAVTRLCDLDREGRRVGKGRYLFPANYGEEDAIESDASGVAMIAS
jgi:hypothetical protein